MGQTMLEPLLRTSLKAMNESQEFQVCAMIENNKEERRTEDLIKKFMVMKVLNPPNRS
jgi:hypothetical protein